MASERPAALLLSPEAPYPLAGGGAMRTASLLNWLSSRYDVDLVVFREPGAPDPAASLPPGLVRSVAVIPLRRHARHTAARLWRNFGRFVRGAPPLNDRFDGYEKRLGEALSAGRRYELGLIEHFWCAAYAPILRPRCRRLAIDLHNIESALYFRNAAAAAGPERVLMHHLGNALLRLERQWLPAFDTVIATSDQDAKTLAGLTPGCPALVYPNAIPYIARPQVPSAQEIVFSGNLEYYPNRTAVRFFHNEIWPLLAAKWPGLRWKLVGKNPDAVRALVAADPRVVLTGPLDDAITSIAAARVAVVPLLSGSGTRVKILEAWAAGVPVVSTSVGAEGLDAREGEDLLLADSPAEFAACVDRILSSTELRGRLAVAGRHRYEQSYTWEAAWEKLDAAALSFLTPSKRFH